MELELYCLRCDSVFFPSEKFVLKVDLQRCKTIILFIDKQEYLGIVRQETTGELCEYGLMAKIVGSEHSFSLINNMNNSSYSKIFQGYKRIKIISRKDVSDSDGILFLANVKIMEDEISNISILNIHISLS